MPTFKIVASNGGNHEYTGTEQEVLNDCASYASFPSDYDFAAAANKLTADKTLFVVVNGGTTAFEIHNVEQRVK